MPAIRTLIRVAAAVAVGAAATTMFAAPASAWEAKLAGKGVCDTKTGKVTVTWTLTNDWQFPGWKATFVVKDQTPADSKVSPTTGELPAFGDGDVTLVQKDVPGDTEATITVEVTWPDRMDDKGDNHPGDTKIFKGAPVKVACEAPSPSPSASHSASTSPSPAVPSLPVTGSNTPIYGGVAVGLVGIGAGLFVVARRRRIRFEA